MKRIQRKRTKGWRMPDNAVYVGRPTRWGNPYENFVNSEGRLAAITDYERWLKEKLAGDPNFLAPLRGKDLACWCPLELPCHADVILKYLEMGH